MGFERLCSILQSKDSNYDTDIFVPIFNAIQKVTGCRAYEGRLGPEDIGLIDMAYRVVADHIRTLTFAITDGAVPSNDGRGYVLRRILRRAVRYGQEILGAPAGFFTQLVPVVVENFSVAFPELVGMQSFVMNVIADEEQSFNRTLDQGVKHFKKVTAAMVSSGLTVVPSKEAHLLFSSMGFPLDLTELMAAEMGLTVDAAGFHELMDNDRKISEAAENARKGSGLKDLSMEAEQTAWLQSQSVPITDSSSKYEWNISHKSTVVALFLGRGTGSESAGFVNAVSVEDGQVGIILNSTSFYYESGGQVSDSGSVEFDGGVFACENANTYGGYVVHIGTLSPGSKGIRIGDAVEVKVDYSRRGFIAPNHTMTHVLNCALRKVLLGRQTTGGQCEQKGSLVDTEKLRFDFSWNGSLNSAQLSEVENLVNQVIQSGLPVHAQVIPLASASQVVALRRVFGESYPDPVRMVSVGVDTQTLLQDPTNLDWFDHSVEFCGGTHLSNTSQAEDFVIVEESGIAKGIRRITGLTRNAAKAARELAASLLARLEALERLEGSRDLQDSFKLMKIEVCELNGVLKFLTSENVVYLDRWTKPSSRWWIKRK